MGSEPPREVAVPGGDRRFVVDPARRGLIVAGKTGTLSRVTLTDLLIDRTLENAHEGEIDSLAISPNGQLLATGGSDRRIVLRDPATFDRDGPRHGIELLDSAPVGLFRGYGDCDLKARLFVALCLASGLVAEIDPVFRGAYGFPHVRAKVLRATGETSGAPQQWDVADPTIINSTIGHLPDHPLTTWNEAACP